MTTMAIRFIFPGLLAYFFLLPAFAITIAPYTPPESGETADLVISARPNVRTKWEINIYDDPKTCSGAKLVLAGEDQGDKIATKITANTIVTFGYEEFANASFGCLQNFTFTPQAGRVYLLQIKGYLNRVCTVFLNDATDPKNQIPVPLISRNRGRTPCTAL